MGQVQAWRVVVIHRFKKPVEINDTYLEIFKRCGLMIRGSYGDFTKIPFLQELYYPCKSLEETASVIATIKATGIAGLRYKVETEEGNEREDEMRSRRMREFWRLRAR